MKNSLLLVSFLLFSPVGAQSEDSNTSGNFQNYALVGIVGAILFLLFAVTIWFAMRRSTPPALAMAQQQNTDRDDNSNRRISVSSFPLVPVSENHQEPECSICLGEFKAGELVRVLPLCGHRHHDICIRRWMTNGRSSCPDCREDYASVP